MDFIKNIIKRFDYSITFFTILELLFAILIYPLMRYANPNLFIENGVVENLQVIILSLAVIIGLISKQDKHLFWFCSLIIIFLIIRETNLGRSYFCAKYLTPSDTCKWQNFKYGYLADYIRILYAVIIAIYAVYTKVYKTIWQYIIKAPIYIWEFLLMMVGIVGGTLAEHPSFDSEIAEECFETLFYICLSYALWRYTHCRFNK